MAETKKQKNRRKLLDFMGDPENEFPNRQTMALSVIGYKDVTSLYKMFTTDEMTDIENEAMEERKRRSSKDRAKVYKSLLSEAGNGNVAAIKEYLDRTEGKVKEKIEHTGENGAALIPTINVTLTGN